MRHFGTYCFCINMEFNKRGYKISEKSINKLNDFFQDKRGIDFEELFKDWHNDRYLKQCLLNLQEKYDCGGITQEEWDKIYNKFSYIID